MCCLVAAVSLAQAADPLTLCTAGEVCWLDRSGGIASTELRFRAEGGEITVTVGPGLTSFRFVDAVRGSNVLPSDWLCVQARQRTADGTLSPWYLSDKEGVCNLTAKVLPPAPVPPPPPAPVDPPPAPVPPPVPPAPVPVPEIFSGVTNSKGVLSFDYAVTDCKRGVQQAISALKDGRRTITLMCRK